MTIEEISDVVRDHIPPAIGLTRRYQTLQALVNCTRRSLLTLGYHEDFDVRAERERWEKEIKALEAMGIS